MVFVVGLGLNFQDVIGNGGGDGGAGRLGAKLSRCKGNWWWCLW